MYKLITILVAVLVLGVGIGQSGANKRAYVAGKYALDLDGAFAGWLHSAEGGHAVADVVEEPEGPFPYAKKHIANVKYEDISIACSTGMSKALYDWIKASFDHKPLRKSGAIIAADYDLKEQSRLTFTEALISEVSFPALDGASKDAAKMTIKFKPEITRRSTGSGKAVGDGTLKQQKKWLPSNFRLKIDGLDEATARVNKVEALSVKQKFVEGRLGQIEPGKLEYPNLVISTSESHSKTIWDWHDSFVIKGNAGDEQEKKGTLEYLSPDLKASLFTLEFSGLGIFKVAPDKMEAGAEGIRRVKAEMYCEEMRFSYSLSEP